MHKIKYIDAATILLPVMNDSVKSFLKYRDLSVDYQLSKLKQNARRGWGGDYIQDRINDLKDQQIKYAYETTPDGDYTANSGLAYELSEFFKWEIEPLEKDFDEGLIPWKKKPEHKMWDHQQEAYDACLKNRHAGVSLPTGSGKSFVILNLIKHYGVKSIIVAPAKSIAKQLYDDFVERFGTKYVGFFGDGKKVSKKLFTIAIAKSISNLEEGDEHFKEFKKVKLLICDEAHQFAATEFKKVCLGAGRNAYYRFFFSATHTRNDGSEIILKGLTGKIVVHKEFSDLVDAGILARPVWRMFEVPPINPAGYSDPAKEIRANYYNNDNIIKLSASIANSAVEKHNRPTCILIQEFIQFIKLYPYISVPFVFANGGTSKFANQDVQRAWDSIPEKYKTMDSKEAIRKFNSGEVKLIIGTSSVSTGVDLKPTQCLLNLQGGKSEIKVKQGIGRGTRMGPEGKTDCWMIDFIVKGSKTLERHAKIRAGMYEGMHGSVKVIGLNETGR